jgi:hypothetical protein
MLPAKQTYDPIDEDALEEDALSNKSIDELDAENIVL